MRNMFAAVLVSSAFLQGCTTMPDLTEMSEAKQMVETEQFARYVGNSESSHVLTSTGECLRSVELSSENLMVECQASAEAVVADKAPEPAPAPAQLARLSYDGTALFAFDSAELSLEGRGELSKLVAKLNGNADIGSIVVVGHADSIGATDYNQSLSESRAEVVRQFLKSSLQSVEVTTSGLGESSPVADNATSAGRQRNRRVEVQINAVEAKSVFE